MKSIRSAGGPLVGISHAMINHWSGVEGKTFIGKDAPYSNDYEAAGELVGGLMNSPCNISRLTGESVNILLITMPYETAVIDSNGTVAYIAQVEYGESDWSFDCLDIEELRNIVFDENISFTSEDCTFSFFDAAYAAPDIGDDFISFPLQSGNYLFSSAFYQKDELTNLIVYRVMKIS